MCFFLLRRLIRQYLAAGWLCVPPVRCGCSGAGCQRPLSGRPMGTVLISLVVSVSLVHRVRLAAAAPRRLAADHLRPTVDGRSTDLGRVLALSRGDASDLGVHVPADRVHIRPGRERAPNSATLVAAGELACTAPRVSKNPADVGPDSTACARVSSGAVLSPRNFGCGYASNRFLRAR